MKKKILGLFVLLFEFPLALLLYSLFTEPQPPVHSEGPAFYLGMEAFCFLAGIAAIVFIASLFWALWTGKL
jgi:hypothetical protein